MKILAREQGYVSTLLGRRRYIPELQARTKALLRRAQRMRVTEDVAADAVHRHGQLSIDAVRREVRIANKVVVLTAKEFDLLLFMASNPGRVYTRAQLLDAVWGTTLESYEHNVNTHINRLRSKIESDPANREVPGLRVREVEPAH